MNKELKELFKYLKKTNNASFDKIFKLAQDVSVMQKGKAVKNVDDESIMINISDLISLVKPDVDVQKQQIGLVTANK